MCMVKPWFEIVVKGNFFSATMEYKLFWYANQNSEIKHETETQSGETVKG